MFKSHKTHSPHTASALLPTQVAKCYNFPTGIDLSKRTVAILELGGAFQLSDVVAYCKRYGFKVPRITTIFVDGAAEQSDPQGADGEVSLDLDVIAAVAQGVHIAVVFAPNSDAGFIDGLKACIDLDPDAVSISWGSPEDSWDSASRASLDALMKQAAEKGIAVFCASGDNGSSDGESTGSHCDYPASSPFAIACGGTHLELNPDGTRLTETAWSSTALDVGGTEIGNSEGSGGGISAVYATTPDWQKGALPSDQPGRRSPDISGNADPATGYQVDIDGTITQIGGTSAVAPLYAALQSILNESMGQHVGNLHTKLYLNANSGIFFDVTQGTNGHYKASEGYDCVTGNGVIDAKAFIEVLKSTAVPAAEPKAIFDGVDPILLAPLSTEHHMQFADGLAKAQAGSWYPELVAILKLVCQVGEDVICPIVQQLPPCITK